MDFSRLPFSPFLHILGYLPFNERVRSGRVNKSFRCISQLAIADTKCLDLTEYQFKKLHVHELVGLLKSCAPNLEKIRFPQRNDGALYVMAFSTFQCPRLTELDLIHYPVGNDIFERIVRNNRNIKVLTWSGCLTNDGEAEAHDLFLYPDIVNENLEKLSLYKCNDYTLRSLVGYCPNLKELKISMENISEDTFDFFFESIPQLQKIEIALENSHQMLEDSEYFWCLPLTLLSIKYGGRGNDLLPTDHLLHRIASSLPHLKTLSMELYVASSHGIAALANLHDLEVLELYLPNSDFDGFDGGFRELARCGKLRRLRLCNADLHIDTLIDLIRFCPNLNDINFDNIDDVNCETQAAEALEKLFGLGERDVAITFYIVSHKKIDACNDIWNSKEVKGVMSKLKDSNGTVVKFCVPKKYY